MGRGRPKKNNTGMIDPLELAKNEFGAELLASYVSHPLFDVFSLAIDQVASGKGDRHGGDKTPFTAQPWSRLAEVHGIGFLTGQAAKKLEEAVTNHRPGTDEYEREMLGVLAYVGMALLHAKEIAPIEEA